MTDREGHDHLAQVQELYSAFGRVDVPTCRRADVPTCQRANVPTILGMLAHDVDFAAEASASPVPWYGPHSGREGAGRIFVEIGAKVDVSEFDKRTVVGHGDELLAAFHWWRFGPDGRVVAFRGSEDTEQAASAFAG